MEKIDFIIHKGETFRHVLSFKDSDGAALDLTGWTATFQVRPFPGSEELIAEAVCEIDAEAGTITLEIADSVTKQIVIGNYAYDLATRDSENTVKFQIGGGFAVVPSVTVLP